MQMNLPKKAEQLIRDLLSFAGQNDIPIMTDWDENTGTINITRCNSFLSGSEPQCFDYKLLQMKIEELGFELPKSATAAACPVSLCVKVGC